MSYRIVFMANLSVAEAAKRLGVGVPRIHQRIADGSLRAERIGSQWVVDELSLLRVGERTVAGRPLSARSAWALIALSEGDEMALSELAAVERARARERLERLIELAAGGPGSEDQVRGVAAELRAVFRNRAGLERCRAAASDLPSLREDVRWESLVSTAVSGIASMEVEGYVESGKVKSLVRDFLLLPGAEDANVLIHVLPVGQKAYPESKLLLAADLADHRGPREELRAVELLREVADDFEGVSR
jgi:excisionase family DNA binding protein